MSKPEYTDYEKTHDATLDNIFSGNVQTDNEFEKDYKMQSVERLEREIEEQT